MRRIITKLAARVRFSFSPAEMTIVGRKRTKILAGRHVPFGDRHGTFTQQRLGRAGCGRRSGLLEWLSLVARSTRRGWRIRQLDPGSRGGISEPEWPGP